MRNRMTTSVYRSALIVALTLWLAASPGCKRGSDQPQPPAGAPTTPLEDLPVASLEGLPAEVREQFRADLRAARKRPDEASTVAKVAMMHHAYGFLAAADKWYPEAIKRAEQVGADRDAFVYRYYLADVQVRLDDLRNAILTLNVALSRRPDDVHGHLRRAQLLHVLNQQDLPDPSTRPPTTEVRLGYRRVLDRDPTIAPAHYGLGRIEIESDNPRDAVPHLEEALRLAPDYVEARAALAKVKEQIGDAAGAQALRDRPSPPESDSGYVDPYLKALEEQTSHERTKLQHALRLVQQGFAEEAEAYVRLMTVEDPSSAPVWGTLATIQLGRTRSADPADVAMLVIDAKKNLLQALELDPSFHQARLNYAQILRAEGELEAAIDTAGEIIIRDDDYWKAHYQLGEWLAQKAAAVSASDGPLAAQPIYEQSKEHYRRTIELHPNNMYAHSGWARVLETEGRFPEMHELLRDAVHKQPDDPGVADQLARLLATCEVPSIRRPEEAVRISLRVFEVTKGKYPQYTLTLAIAYENLEDFDAALKAINDAIDEAALQGLDGLSAQLRAYKVKIEATSREFGK